MMDTDTTPEQGQDVTDLGQLLVLVIQSAQRIVEDVFDGERLFFLVHVDLGHLHCKGLALSFGKGKDDDGVEILEHDHFDQLVNVGSLA